MYYSGVKKVFAVFFSLFLSLVLAVSVSAQSENANIPERNGDFPVPGRSDVRVRVFVHEPKEKPTVSTSAVCSDNPSDAVVGAAGWKLPSGTWKYKINPASVPSSVGSSNLATIASNSFAKWMSYISSGSPNLVADGTTTKTRNALDYENIITWGRTQGSALGVTYVWYYTATHIVADVDTIMNKKFAWSLGVCSTTSYDAENILIHELGHWFGLDDEYDSSFVENTMFGYGAKAERKKVTPENGDKAGIDLIY